MKDLDTVLDGSVVEIYDGNTALGAAFHKAGAQRVTVFAKHPEVAPTTARIVVRPYGALLEAADCVASVCVLNEHAIKVLIAMYPTAPKYVLVRLAWSSAWFLGLPGLLRRMLFGFVHIEGIAKLAIPEMKQNTYWLVLEQSGGAVHSIPVLPQAVGIPAFLEWLRAERIAYVVLRFFERLPELHREAGDLDILVSDEDKSKVEQFLSERANLARDDAGDVRVGIHSVSGEAGMLPYYPPTLARKILDGAVDGPAQSRIPNPKDTLCSFMYHALYHGKKGYASGIPSTLNKHTDAHPENDYFGAIAQMAKQLNVTPGETMEDMDDFLAEEGWRPKLDTLAKMAETNAWVSDRFFNATNTENNANGLAVFVLREWVLERGLVEEVLAHVKRQGYIIIRSKTLDEEEKKRATEQLRGGTWGSDAEGNTDGWMPAYVMVVVDTKCARMPATYATGFELFRIRTLKELLRKRFDTDGLSSMHSTDNTHESWEYIEVCFPDEYETIRAEVLEHTKSSRWFGWVHALSPKYLKHSSKHSLRSWLIRTFLK